MHILGCGRLYRYCNRVKFIFYSWSVVNNVGWHFAVGENRIYRYYRLLLLINGKCKHRTETETKRTRKKILSIVWYVYNHRVYDTYHLFPVAHTQIQISVYWWTPLVWRTLAALHMSFSFRFPVCIPIIICDEFGCCASSCPCLLFFSFFRFLFLFMYLAWSTDKFIAFTCTISW